MQWKILLTILLLIPTLTWGEVTCSRLAWNLKGTANAQITIDDTAGGIIVADGNVNRCSIMIHNSGSNPVTCATAPVTPTATAGFIIQTQKALSIDSEGKQEFRCFSASGTTVQVVEGLP